MDEILLNQDSAYSESSMAEVDQLKKALLAPGSTSDMYATPGGVITQQSLEGMLVNLTLNQKDFTFWQDVNKSKAFSTVEEFDQQIGFGISEGGFVGAMENPEFRDPDIKKGIAQVKYMSEGWTTSDVAESTNTIVDHRTIAQQAAMMRLLRNLNRAFYTGNSAWIPQQFDGLSTAIAGSSSDQVYDLRGGTATMNTFNLAGQLITEANGYVENSNVYCSPAGLQALSKIIEASAAATGDRKIVQMGTAGITIGGKISDIMTNFGNIKIRMDKLLGLEFEGRPLPQYFNNQTGVWVEGKTADKAPSLPTIALTNNASTTGSKFAASTERPSAATYSYRVVARNAYGKSKASVLATSSAVAAGGSVSVAITPNPGDTGANAPSCFEIYSERVSGSGVFQYMDTIAANGLEVVTYVDKNVYIPGTARMYIVDQTSGGMDRVMAFSQLLPIHNTDLAKVGRYTQGLINLYGVPKYYKPQVLVEIRNIGVDQSNSNKFNLV